MDLGVLIDRGMEFFGIRERGSIKDKLSKYVDELFRWQRHINLTGFKEPESLVKNLIYEALFTIKYLKGKERVIDFGSGSGTTSIVFSLLLESQIISVERNMKKVSFQKHIKRMLKIPNLHVLCGSIEEIEPLGACAVFAKAVGKVEKIVRKVDKHLISPGTLLIPKGREEEPSLISGYVLEMVEPLITPLNEKKRKLFVYRKL